MFWLEPSAAFADETDAAQIVQVFERVAGSPSKFSTLSFYSTSHVKISCCKQPIKGISYCIKYINVIVQVIVTFGAPEYNSVKR